MFRRRLLVATAALAVAVSSAAVGVASAAPSADTRVSVGSPVTPFSQNKQNEPAVAVDAAPPQRPGRRLQRRDRHGGLRGRQRRRGPAGSQCPFTAGGGRLRASTSRFDGGQPWTQPTYTGRQRAPLPRPDAVHGEPDRSDRHAALVRRERPGLRRRPGPRLRPRAGATGSSPGPTARGCTTRTSPRHRAGREATFKGFEAIAVSRTDDVRRRRRRAPSRAWKSPVIVSKQSSTTFSDKEQIWADNASSSPYFGNVYVCCGVVPQQQPGQRAARPAGRRPLHRRRRHLDVQAGRAGVGQPQQRPGRRLHGAHRQPGQRLRLSGPSDPQGKEPSQMMYRSTDGGAHFDRPAPWSPPPSPPGVLDPDPRTAGRWTVSPAPASTWRPGRVSTSPTARPTGAGATDEIVMTWADGRAGTQPRAAAADLVSRPGLLLGDPGASCRSQRDRPVYTAPAVIARRHATCTSSTTRSPRRTADTTSPRGLVGRVQHAGVVAGVPTGWSVGRTGERSGTRAAPARTGSPPSSSVTTCTPSRRPTTPWSAVWNDARDAADCPAIDAYRASLYTATPASPPNVIAACPAAFGNSDIYGGRWPDPTP